MENIQNYKNIVLNLFCETAKVYTLRFLRPLVEIKHKKSIERIYDIFVTMAFGQIRKVRALNSNDDLPTQSSVVLHKITCDAQRDACKQVLQYCMQKDRLDIIDAEIEKSLQQSQALYQQLPAQLLTIQQRHFDSVYRLRPLLVRDDQTIFNHQKIFTFFKQEANEERGDYRQCNDTTSRTLVLDDLIPEKFYFGDSPSRAGAFYAINENFANLAHQSEGDQD